MVFSQTSHKTQSILKVVDIDRLKPNKDQQVNGQTGVITGGNSQMMPSLAAPTTSCFSEEYLKVEPAYDNTMFHDTDCEFFQDLVQWCSDPAKEEPALTIDSKKITEERAHKNDTYTPMSPYGWETFDTNSPTARTGINCTTPNDPLSPTTDGAGEFQKLLSPDGLSDPNKMQYPEQFLDFNNMPVVFGDLGSETVADVDAVQTAGLIGWDYINNTNDNINTHTTSTHDTMPFIETEDSKLLSVIPRELESNDVIITEVIFGLGGASNVAAEAEPRQGLTINIPARVAGWPSDIISTPDIVSCVEQLENESGTFLPSTPADWMTDDTEFISTDVNNDVTTPPKLDYEPITPKSESQVESDNDDKSYTSSRKRRYDSDDSDETYTPYQEPTSTRRKYTRRKPNVPIKDMIKALEGSQPLKKARRGRPPKRRESTVSSVYSIDESSMSGTTTQESKYRELRDKNNEASKRSRMNKKLKELQVEQLAIELEERNKKLQIKVDILEDMTKRLKEALMTAILQKK